MRRAILAEDQRSKNQFRKRKPKRGRRSPKNCSGRVNSGEQFPSSMTRSALSILLLARRVVAFGIGGTILASTAFSGVRLFTFLYEAPTSPPRSIDIENTVTGANGANCNA